ncbi:MAG: GNAT family N-acetyltransferase [Dehalogenimonas sp.]
MNIMYKTFTIDDFVAAVVLWQSCEGIGLSDADSKCNIQRFLERNPNTSFAAYDGEILVGTVLGGHDGRRGYLYHLAVHPDRRKRGVGRNLAAKCLDALSVEGIRKCHLFIFNQNKRGIAFWNSLGWTLRSDIAVISRVMETGTC